MHPRLAEISAVIRQPESDPRCANRPRASPPQRIPPTRSAVPVASLLRAYLLKYSDEGNDAGRSQEAQRSAGKSRSDQVQPQDLAPVLALNWASCQADALAKKPTSARGLRPTKTSTPAIVVRHARRRDHCQIGSQVGPAPGRTDQGRISAKLTGTARIRRHPRCGARGGRFTFT